MSTLSRSSMNTTPDHLTHSLLEDVLAILIGTLLVAFGVIFFAINLPFYWLAWRRMGWRFTLKTFIAVSLLSVFTSMHGQFLHLGGLNPFYTGLVGGLMMGMGFIALFRHQASLGGFNILALYLQDRYGIRAGKLQLGLDLLILATSLLLVSWPALLGSILGAVAMNMVIGFNHRPDRYIAM